MTNRLRKTSFSFAMVKVRIMCYLLIHAKLRQFLRKLASGPGWIRFPSPAPMIIKDFDKEVQVSPAAPNTSKKVEHAPGGSQIVIKPVAKLSALFSIFAPVMKAPTA